MSRLPAAVSASTRSSTSSLPANVDATALPRRVLAVAHRGASTEFRENTLPAFARALALGADAIELDVRVTRDGIVVVHHDEGVRRSPDEGVPVAIHGLSLAELRTVDLGDGTRVPTLDEVMELVAGRAEVFVELKRPVAEAPVIACVERHRAPFALHSFDHDAIARLAVRAPHIRRGILFDDPLVHPLLELTVHLDRTKAHDVWPRFDHVDRAFVDTAHALGARVIPWTVNDAATGRELTSLGVDGICTDDVRWLRTLDESTVGSPTAPASSTFAPPPMHI